MKLLYLITIFVILSRWACAQHDSTHFSVNNLQNLSSIQWLKDSLTIDAWADSLKKSAQKKFSTDSLGLKNKIDSLSSMKLSTEPYSSRFDSLLSNKQNRFNEIEHKKKKLETKIKGKLDQWQEHVRSRLDSLGIKGAIPSPSVPELNQIDISSFTLPELPSLSSNDFTTLDLSTDLSSFNKELPFSSIEGLQEFQGNLSEVREKISMVSDLKNNTGQTIETVVGEMDAIKEIQKQTQAFEAANPLANTTGQLPDEEQIKEQAVKKGINYFAGKDKQLSQAMNQISKYKQKYSSVKSLKDLPKTIPNAMKEKSFIERLAPELMWQVFIKDNFMLDVAPYVGYKLSERLTVGAGWNKRFIFNIEKSSNQTNVYGPRLYGAYIVVKAISLRLELETMNAFVAENITNADVGQREWVPAILAGMKQEYKIYKNLKGTALVLYNFYNPDYKSPYGDRLNMRFGLEYHFIGRKR